MTPTQFLCTAALFEGLLLLAAFGGGWLFGINPTLWLSWSPADLMLGCLATVPMLVMLAICMVSKASGLLQIRRFLRQSVGVHLAECRIHDIFLLALVAGVCEEILFRGFLYQWISNWNVMLAVLIVNLLFALAHSITALYAMLAAMLGLYLTSLIAVDLSPNLLIPVTAHTVYDFAALLVVVADFRKNAANDPDPESSDRNQQEDG